MKKFLIFILVALGVGSGIYLISSNYIYQGEVVGKLEVSNPYRIGTTGPYNYIDITFVYKDTNGKFKQAFFEQEDVYYLKNDLHGKLLKEGKVYFVPWWSIVIGLLLIIGSVVIFIWTCITWGCFCDHDYHFHLCREAMSSYCYNKCDSRNLCYFANTKIHISNNTKNEFKHFFGY